ncbi:hypothetical protein PPL_07518 [Heterostelium album PN500]|uniref:Uncharacterized protein n=1 Tax=Heterostelium pallidum (strain ATCC 26659 / Pp 5 / PN500) TaxID=670386 RepID=D3BG67_HETP5|nr:hypothetical protein PPL_07518 [Heterostelium album PN500]EFA79659.1 hypothetical protein PPL_07518 [Heterostelium album PN500]|eukprot:XP_020431780.1 hypothetical protein PPL_07518 [Heterostelium album PN500]
MSPLRAKRMVLNRSKPAVIGSIVGLGNSENMLFSRVNIALSNFHHCFLIMIGLNISNMVSTDRIIQLFSRVETFRIKSDEFDSMVKNGIELREYLCDEYSDSEELDYTESIVKEQYLVHLPPMPNLKNITVDSYNGYKSNYSSFLTSILTSTPNGDGHGI